MKPRLEMLEARRVLAVMTVTALSDGTLADLAVDGELSLREAIESINTASVVDAIPPTSGTFGSNDQIRFAPDLFSDGPAFINLMAGELAVMAPVQIVGPGAAALMIDAAGNDPTPDEDLGDGSRIFHIDDQNSSIASPVVISGLTLAGADSSSPGGAIRSVEPLTIRDSGLDDNAATRGGGVDWEGVGGDLVVESVSITQNRAGVGAGISWIGESLSNLRITQSTISGNIAIGSVEEPGIGGGISWLGSEAGDLSISDSEIIDNMTDGNGGGIAWNGSDSGRLSLIESNVVGNKAATEGGGIAREATSSGALQIMRTRISENEAEDGAGISTTVIGDGGALQITDAWIDGNVATFGGGLSVTRLSIGPVNPTPSQSTIVRSTISGNTAEVGGGLYWFGSLEELTIDESTISGNNALESGGGITWNAYDGTLRISQSTIVKNTAKQSGGLALATNVDMTNTVLAGNVSTTGADFTSTFASTSRFNLVGNPSSAGGLVDGVQGNIIGSVDVSEIIDTSLSQNGGPTPTHALVVGSPAIDAGDPSITANGFDQRGTPFPRLIDGNDDGQARVDIGAFEGTLPTILSVKVGASIGGANDWSPAFKAAVDPIASVGFAIATSGSTEPPLPWSTIRQVFVTFESDIGELPETDVSLTGINVNNYSPVVSYDDTTRTATLTLAAPIEADRLTLRLLNSTVDPSDRVFEFSVMPGDTNRSGAVSVNDVGGIRNGLGTSAGQLDYSIFADLNGSGSIAVNDVFPLRTNLGLNLPTPSPPAAVATHGHALNLVDAAMALWGRDEIRKHVSRA